jgi:hypothetical protein
MVSAAGEEGKKRSKTIDFLLLLGASLFVAAGSTAAFWVAGEHHINLAWLFGAGAALIFFLVVGWGYRRKLRDPVFVSFFWLGCWYTSPSTCWSWVIWVSSGTSQS